LMDLVRMMRTNLWSSKVHTHSSATTTPYKFPYSNVQSGTCLVSIYTVQ
jgi:hypothetical protein